MTIPWIAHDRKPRVAPLRERQSPQRLFDPPGSTATMDHAHRPHRMPVWRSVVGYALLKSIHLLGVIAWVGGMFFALACLRPAAAALEPPLRVALMRDALGRFLNIVLVASGLVLVSGVWMIATASRVSVKAGIGFAMPLDWHVMVTLGVVMIAVFAYIRF